PGSGRGGSSFSRETQMSLSSATWASSSGGIPRHGLRIVIFGKTEDKKNSLCNLIIQKNQTNFFKFYLSKKCELACGEWRGKPVKVVKFPDIFSLSMKALLEEINSCLNLCLPGPNVLLLLVKPSDFNEKDRKILNFNFTLILFTHGDKLESHHKSIEEFIEKDCDKSFKKLIADCRGRYHLFENYNSQNHTHVTELITKIDAMVQENGSRCFTNDMLLEAEKRIEELLRRHNKEKEDMERNMTEVKSKTEQQIKEKDIKIKEIEKRLKMAEDEKVKDRARRQEEESKLKLEREAYSNIKYFSYKYFLKNYFCLYFVSPPPILSWAWDN
uniref:AIG1-type G domain-containing protein n=1 Tax=Fundulus heteroclitus TaxID=8078 RepID=A0A3Q2R3Q5_FUNHE